MGWRDAHNRALVAGTRLERSCLWRCCSALPLLQWSTSRRTAQAAWWQHRPCWLERQAQALWAFSLDPPS